MPGVFRNPELEGDIAFLLAKYPSIDGDVTLLENLLRDGRVPSRRCAEFVPAWLWRVEVQIAAFEGSKAEDRCTMVYERDGPECYLLLLYDNDTQGYEDSITLIEARRLAD